ncbi:MAG TPA: hypothetical protein VFG79_12945, partial [Solirubrobacter sp.]|nr:hypothetical protein [Solirubrobacter sp.]
MRGALLAAAAAVLVAPAAAHAATYPVTTADDHVDAAGCTPADCTLREAFAKAEDDDDIQLGAGTYRLASELTSTNHVTLVGAGARSTVVDGAEKTRLLDVQAASLEVHGIHFAHGNAAAGEGGAIAVQPDARLTLFDSAVTDSASASPGGGIVSQGDLTVESSLVARNTAGAGGGGISAYETGSLELVNTTVS